MLTLPAGITPYYQEDTIAVICGDAREVMALLEPGSVQLILVDPPYYKVKFDYQGETLLWDRQWPTREAYLAWIRRLAQEWQRVLTANGSLYCFASPQMAAWVEVTLEEVFSIIQRITWRKPPYSTKAEMFDKELIRMFFPASEAIIFAEQYGADSMALGESGYAAQCEHLHGFIFEPLRAYLDDERKRAGISKAEVNAACGFAPIPGAMASRHYFSSSQWCLPTQEHYEVMQRLFNRNGRSEALRREYEDLRREYEDLRRPFTVHAGVPYTDVWDFATVHAGPGKHPAEKPLPLLRHIIEASSRPGDLVLDCCMGSGSTLEAAKQCGRMAIGIDNERSALNLAVQRLQQEVLPLEPG